MTLNPGIVRQLGSVGQFRAVQGSSGHWLQLEQAVVQRHILAYEEELESKSKAVNLSTVKRHTATE